MQSLEWLNFSVLDWLSCIVFLICWVGYSIRAGKSKSNLSSALHLQREQWMLNAVSLSRLETPRDIMSIGMFERSVAFFASTSILILAGLLTVLGSSDKVATVLSSVHFVSDVVVEQIQVKLLLLILIFVHAFFKFSWSMRSYGFMVTLLGAAPLQFSKELRENPVPSNDAREWANRSAKIISSASHHFNLGLRAYYFALAILTWFIHPILFILASVCVVAVLYRRDFKSYALGNLEQHNSAVKIRAQRNELSD